MATKREDKIREKRVNQARPEESLIDFGDFEQSLTDAGQSADTEIDIDSLLRSDGMTDDLLSDINYPEQIASEDMPDPAAPKEEVSDNIENFFDQYVYSDSKAVTDFVDQVSKVISGEEDNRPVVDMSLSNYVPEPIVMPNSPWEEPEPEPDLFEESSKYRKGGKSLLIRAASSAVVALISIWFTLAYEKGTMLPFGLGNSFILISGTILILQIISSFLGLDILIRGFSGICKASFGVDSLLAVSCIFSFVDGMFLIVRRSSALGIPFGCVFSLAVTCFLVAEYFYRSAMSDTLRNVSNIATPIGVINDIETLDQKSVVKKLPRKTDGFFRNITQEDCPEKAYRFASPIFLLLAVSLAAIVCIAKQNIEAFLHALAAELAVGASFSAALAYALPFRIVSKVAERAGSYVAGWGGSQLIADSDGAILTDDDIFPVGTVGIENVIIYGDDKAKAIVDASSLIIASGAGTAKCFAELLRQQKLGIARVYDFTFCESGGVQGTIRGEKVLVGNSGFMNLLGVRIGQDKEKSSSIYLAVSNKLYARFDLSYVPSNAVQSSLLSLVRTRLSVLFAVRDFNVTPATVRQKFKIPVDNMEHLSVSECYNVTETSVSSNADCLAVLSREGAGPFAAAISAACGLRNIVLIATIVAIAGSVLGMLLLFSIFWFGAAGTVTAGNVLTYLFLNGVLALLLPIFMRKS